MVRTHCLFVAAVGSALQRAIFRLSLTPAGCPASATERDERVVSAMEDVTTHNSPLRRRRH